MDVLQLQQVAVGQDAMDQLRQEVASLHQRLAALETLVMLGLPAQHAPDLSTHSTATTQDASSRPQGLALTTQAPSTIKTSRETMVHPVPELYAAEALLPLQPNASAPSLCIDHASKPEAATSSSHQAGSTSRQALAARQPSTGLPGPSYVSPVSAGIGVPGSVGVPMGRTRVVMHQVVLPAETDSLGICFGGQVLSWIDVCAGLSAKTLAKGPCVTATLDAVHFLRPCRRGTVVIIAAMVNRTFNSSMEVGVRVEAEDMRTGQRAHCCSAYLTFVAQRGPPPRASLTGTTPALAQTPAAASPASATINAASHPFANVNSSTITSTMATRGVTRSSSSGTGLACSAAPTVVATGIGSGGINVNAATPTGQTPTAAAASSTALLPRVIPTTTEHAREHQEADARRQARLAERQRMRSDPELAAQAELCRLRPITHRDGGPTLPPSITPPWLGCQPLGSCTAAIPIQQPPADRGNTTPPQQQQSLAGSHQQLSPDSSPNGSMVRVGSMSHFASSLLENVGPASPNGNNGVHTAQARSRLHQASAFSAASTVDGAGRSDNDESQEGGNHVQCSEAGSNNFCVIQPSLTVAYMTQSIMPHHANTIGITFGGQVMRWMELCAYISASRLRAPHLLTAAVDSLTFVRPTYVGDILYVTSQVTAIFGSSMEVHVSVHGEDPQVGDLFHCADGYITVVAVAASSKHDHSAHGGYAPVKLPYVMQPATQADMIQAKNALMRRDARLQLRTALSRTYSGHGRGMDKPM